MDVLSRVLQAATINPQHDAIKDSSRTITYASLAEEISQAVAGLLGLGVSSGDRVAIRLPTSADALVVAFGCMAIGAIFVPISLSEPASRVEKILGDCQPAVIVSQPDDDGAALGNWVWITFDDLKSRETVTCKPPTQGPVYCIYTSGTTGVPKGVVVGHEGFAHAVQRAAETLGMGTATRTLCISPFHFDGSFASLFPTLAAGGTVIILRREPTVLPRAFVRTAREEIVDTVFATPSFLRLLLASQSVSELAGSALAKIVFGGEASNANHLLGLLATLPDVRLFNLYGPTETVIAVTLHEITRGQLEAGEVPIGQPYRDVTFHLFDGKDRPIVRSGETGELYIGGAQLMEGYWGDPDLSAKVLRRDLVPGSVLYRSGDLARRNLNDDYVYMGRSDRVVKRTGIRTSLDEIERLVCQLPGVSNAGCFATFEADVTRIIVAATAKEGITAQQVLAGLSELLPRSMMPDAIHTIESMPLTAAGKVDYRSLIGLLAG